MTEDEKEKLKLSLKVAKKLEKMSSTSTSTAPFSYQTDPFSNLGSQGALSSDSTSNSELTSLEYNDGGVQDPRIAQIDSLEAIINRLINDSEGDGGGGGGRGEDEEEESGVKDNFTQTISTGDIVITKVFDD